MMRSIGVVAIVWTFFFSSQALCLDIHRGPGESGVALEGKIEAGDYLKLVRYLRSTENFAQFLNSITLDSNGGDVIEAIRIGNLIKSSFGNTFVKDGGSCFSACFVIWASGVWRSMPNSAKLGVHRINLTRKEISITKTEAAVKPLANGIESFLLGMGIPRKITDKMNETSPSDMFVFDNTWLIEQDLITSIGYLPAFIDVAQKKCGPDPYARAYKSAVLPKQDELTKWSLCVDRVRFDNQKLEAKTIFGLLSN